MLAALERNTTASIRYESKSASAGFSAPFLGTQVIRITGMEPGQTRKPVVDLYVLDLITPIKAPYEGASILGKAWSFFGAVVYFLPCALAGLRRNNKGAREKLFRVTGALGALVMTVALLALFPALLAGLIAMLPGDVPWLNTIRNWVLPPVAAAATMPKRLRAGLDLASMVMICFVGYVGMSLEKEVVVGRLSSFVELLAQSVSLRAHSHSGVQPGLSRRA